MSGLAAMLGMRSAIGRISETARLWCAAFDKGDIRELGILATLLQEATEDLADSAKALGKVSEGSG